MSSNNRVVWSEGLFLRPQHFQQQERYFERLCRGRAAGSCAPIRWGFTELEIERDLLGIGKLGLRRAAGCFPDGTPFAMPDDDPLPVPLELTAQIRDQTLYLAVPLRRRARASRTARAGRWQLSATDPRTSRRAMSRRTRTSPRPRGGTPLRTRLMLASRASRRLRLHSAGARAGVPRGRTGGARRSLHSDGAAMPGGAAPGDLPNRAAGPAASAGRSAGRARRGCRSRGAAAEIADFLMLQSRQSLRAGRRSLRGRAGSCIPRICIGFAWRSPASWRP